jgi:hypothetical protein
MWTKFLHCCERVASQGDEKIPTLLNWKLGQRRDTGTAGMVDFSTIWMPGKRKSFF